MAQEVYIVDGLRTPFIKAHGKPNPLSAADLGVWAGRALLTKQKLNPGILDEVVVGCVAPSADEANIARIISLRLGCGPSVPAFTVARNCASGLQALDSAYQNISAGRQNLVLAGGTEAMSRAPLLFTEKMVTWLASLNASKTIDAKLRTILKFRPQYLVPVIALLKGLTDPVVAMNMGQTAEKLAYLFNISRSEMDSFALESHKRAQKAQQAQQFNEEVTTLFDWHGNNFALDNGVRDGGTMEKLATLKPVFDKKYGNVTAANSSQITDGAAMLLLASKKTCKKLELEPLARIVDFAWQGVDPTVMGLGPVHAIAELLIRNKLDIKDIDMWEINEAFAAQVLACVKALQDKEYCKQAFNQSKPFGTIPSAKLNSNGGAIAIGHPVGASGARLALHVAKQLRQKGGRLGIASLCIGGGQGGAILIENADGEI
jgi:acetyl-CoA C-acetyltransferase